MTHPTTNTDLNNEAEALRINAEIDLTAFYLKETDVLLESQPEPYNLLLGTHVLRQNIVSANQPVMVINSSDTKVAVIHVLDFRIEYSHHGIRGDRMGLVLGTRQIEVTFPPLSGQQDFVLAQTGFVRDWPNPGHGDERERFFSRTLKTIILRPRGYFNLAWSTTQDRDSDIIAEIQYEMV